MISVSPTLIQKLEYATEQFHYNFTVGNIGDKKMGDIDVGDGC